MAYQAEYIWIDGQKPTAKLRSKTMILPGPVASVDDLPGWGFDGSSTFQAEGHFSDCALKPVRFIADPIRGGDNILVLCEVLNADGTIHNPRRIEWEAGGAFITPPGHWHAHVNASDSPAWLLPIQDAGLHTYLRSLDIRFS